MARPEILSNDWCLARDGGPVAQFDGPVQESNQTFLFAPAVIDRNRDLCDRRYVLTRRFFGRE